MKELHTKFHASADLLENALKEEWSQSPLNPNNLRYLLWRYKLLHPPLLPVAALFKNYPSYHRIPPNVHQPTVITNSESFVKGKYPKAAYKNYKTENEQPVNIVMKELGIDNYRKFEEEILRDIEKREEQKVEATLHTLYDDEPEVVKGKTHSYSHITSHSHGHGSPNSYSHDFSNSHGNTNSYSNGNSHSYSHTSTHPVTLEEWKPLEPTKNYDTNSIHSQIASPLHTSVVGKLHSGLEHSDFLNNQNIYNNQHYNLPNSFETFVDHDDNPYRNHRPYEIHEETGESSFKPIKTSLQFDDFEDIPVTTHKPKLVLPSRGIQNYESRKRQRKKPVNLDNVSIPDNKITDTNDLSSGRKQHSRQFVPRHHIQSLTTTRPKIQSRNQNPVTDSVTENSKTVESVASEKPQRPTKYQGAASFISSTIVSARGTTPASSVKSKHVPRSSNTSKYVDTPRVTGYRGSIKFNSQKEST